MERCTAAGPLWKEALKILKLVVTRSSVLAVPPSHLHSRSWDHTTTGLVIKSGLYVETPLAIKKELPGRTMDFSFDVSQTPIIGRRFKAKESGKKKGEEGTVTPKRSPSQTAADNVVPVPGWKRPWLSQVIFSQTSELLEHQSSMASSMEEMSNMEASGNESHVEDTTGTDGQFTVFKDFDFLDNEESEDGSDDNFNWGVKRSIPDLALIGRETEKVNMGEGNVISKESHHTIETSSDDDETGGSDDHIRKPPDSLSLQPTRARRPSEDSDSSYVQSSSEGDMGDLTPCNASPCLPGLMSRGIDVASLTSPRDAAPSATLSPQNSEETSAQEHWQSGITTLMAAPSSASVAQAATAFPPLYKDLSNSLRELVEDSIQPLSQIESVGLMIAHLGTLRDSLSSQELPFLWIGPGVVECELQKMKFILLEIHEHFETFIDKKEHAIECLEALRCALKLQSLGEMIEVRNLVEKGLDLCRAIYKLSFQLSLAWDAGSKMVSALSSIICTHSECLNVWADVTEVHNEIQPLLEEIKDVSSSSTDDEDHHGSIVELLQGKHWASAIREFRAQRGMDSSSCLMASEATLTDDLQTILTSYMEYLSSNSVVCLPSVEQFQNDQMLMEGNIQLLSMLRSLEQGSVMECTSSPKKTFPVLV
ncbi:unnamed protein product [Darwinula stevensoni]|uniref:Protein furry C-terminal domain-containing protein n=1 Tax=Darwinula stevensoni TaxID=69355 RepID=A0A7R9FQS6_9CRUS|nr:unnamed protein product [Darwinula stevensoni]CAG0900292.1 unnamed protein product [Darwinula stevensoni]